MERVAGEILKCLFVAVAFAAVSLPQCSFASASKKQAAVAQAELVEAAAAAPVKDSAEEDDELTLIAVGDVMLSRGVLRLTEKLGRDYPFSEVSSELNKADVVFGNLESVLGELRTKPYFNKPYNFIAPPESVLSLKDAGFTVLSLSNNHAMDFGPEPITETRLFLDAAGIAYFGAGANIDEAAAPAFVKAKGVTFAFLGYAIAHDKKVYATKNSAGIISPWDHDRIRRAIKAVRDKADVVVVSLHWGIEYNTMPEKADINLAHKIIDWGADLILGHHPHVVQGVEAYKGKVIAYSMGNFVFDQKKPETLLGMMLKVNFKGGRILSYDVVPLSRHTTVFPAIAEGEERDRVLGKIMSISAPLHERKEKKGGVTKAAGVKKGSAGKKAATVDAAAAKGQGGAGVGRDSGAKPSGSAVDESRAADGAASGSETARP